MDEPAVQTTYVPNGSGLAAIVSAGIGSLALGALVLAAEAGIYSAPALYGPAGGLSGRSTFAVVVWLAAWAVLHTRWGGRELAAGPVFFATLVLIAIGLIAAFPLTWTLL